MFMLQMSMASRFIVFLVLNIGILNIWSHVYNCCCSPMIPFCSMMRHDSLEEHFVLHGKMIWVSHSEGERCFVTLCGHCLSVALMVGNVFPVSFN